MSVLEQGSHSDRIYASQWATSKFEETSATIGARLIRRLPSVKLLSTPSIVVVEVITFYPWTILN